MSFDGSSKELLPESTESGLPRRRRTVAESVPSATPPNAKSVLVRGGACPSAGAGAQSSGTSMRGANLMLIYVPPAAVCLKPPNGSRLSCGRDAHGRKAADPYGRWGGEPTQLFPTGERPAASSAC